MRERNKHILKISICCGQLGICNFYSFLLPFAVVVNSKADGEKLNPDSINDEGTESEIKTSQMGKPLNNAEQSMLSRKNLMLAGSNIIFCMSPSH